MACSCGNTCSDCNRRGGKVSSKKMANGGRASGRLFGNRVEDPTALRNTITGRTLPADTIDAKLGPGEYVVNAESAAVVGYDFLDRINNIGLDGPQFSQGELPSPSHYQHGGVVNGRHNMARGYNRKGYRKRGTNMRRKTSTSYQTGGRTVQRPPVGPGGRISGPRNIRPRRAIPRPPGPGLPPPDWRKQYGHATRQRGGKMNLTTNGRRRFQTGGHTHDASHTHGINHSHRHYTQDSQGPGASGVPNVTSNPIRNADGSSFFSYEGNYSYSPINVSQAQHSGSNHPWDASYSVTNGGHHHSPGYQPQRRNSRTKKTSYQMQRGGGINLKTLKGRR